MLIDFFEPVAASHDDVLNYLRACPPGITFVHGKAGSGKTYLVRKLLQQLSRLRVQVLAPTNLAASLYGGARTLHSFFYGGFDDLGLGVQDPRNLDSDRIRARFGSRLEQLDMIVVDEISMVRADTLEMINWICRYARESTEPFGGLSFVVVGDLFQLPPVVEDEAVEQYLISHYGGIYFFHSDVVSSNLPQIKLFELCKSYRQGGDRKFEAILDEFRHPLSPSRKIELVDMLNSRVSDSLPDDAVYIASSNEGVSRINAEKLASLPGPEGVAEATFSIRIADGGVTRSGQQMIEVRASQLPVDEDIMPIVVPSKCEAVLRYKIGARVMLCTGSSRLGYVNGDMGVITAASANSQSFAIRLDRTGAQIAFPSQRFERLTHRYEFNYDPASRTLVRGDLIQVTNQVPLRLAYAFTIHKSQGQTYDKVILDLNSHIFAPGQLYVALSRVRALRGLYLTKPVQYSDIIADDCIFQFISNLRRANGATTLMNFDDPIGAGVLDFNNPRCDDFISFVRYNEPAAATASFLIATLESYKQLFAYRRYDMAHGELRKVVDVITADYQTVRYDALLQHMSQLRATRPDCAYILNAIFEIYTDVIHTPRRQLHL